MPCYIRVAKILGISLPQDIDTESLEEILMRELKVPINKHELLRYAINEMLAENPEKLKEILIEAKALAVKKKAPFPDRLQEAREKAQEVWKRVNS